MYVKAPGNGMAVAGFVLGLIGAVTGLIPLFFAGAFLFSILGLVFSGIGIKKAGRPEIQRAGRKLAIAGLVLSVVAFGLGIVGVAVTGRAVNDLSNSFDKASQEWSSYTDCINHATAATMSDCTEYLDHS